MNSLRSRILVPLLSMTALILCIFGFVFDRTLCQELISSMDAKLKVMAQGVATSLELKMNGQVEFDPADIGVPELTAESEDAFFTIVHSGGRRIVASGNTPEPVFAEGSLDSFERRSVGGKPFRVCRMWIELEPESDEDDEDEDDDEIIARSDHDLTRVVPPQKFQIEVGSSTAELDATIASFRRKLLFGASILFVVLMLAPFAFVTLALRGLRRLSLDVDHIGPDEPEFRLQEEGVGIEARALVGALNRAVDRLAAAHEREKCFSADVAHELRTPLSAIRTRCEVVLRRPRTREDLRESLESILRSSIRLGRLVEKMLMLSRYQRQAVQLTLRETDLSQIVEDVSNLHRHEAAKKGIRFRVVTDLPPVRVQGDEELLRECVSNLIHNAVRYTPERGEVWVKTVDGAAPGIVVTDTGVGIEASHLDKIFNRFYRVDPAREQVQGSFGLGLALAQEIAQLHGTSIRVESTPGRGSRFEVMFSGCPSVREADGQC